MASATPALVELLQTAVDSQLYELHTACPGQVTAVHTDNASRRQFADVRPSLRRVLPIDPDEGLEPPYAEEILPVISRVPIAYAQGGGYAITWPLAVGDFVLLVFAERSIDQWLAVAQKGQLTTVSTGDLGMHTLDGAVALPLGPAPSHELLQSIVGDALTIGADKGKTITITPTRIVLGKPDATDAVALASKVLDELVEVQSDLAALEAATLTAITALEGKIPGFTTPPGPVIATKFAADVADVPHTPQSVASSVVGAE